VQISLAALKQNLENVKYDILSSRSNQVMKQQFFNFDNFPWLSPFSLSDLSIDFSARMKLKVAK